MVDELRVRRLVRWLTESISQLAEEAMAGSERRADPMWLPAVKYSFVTAVEACADVAQHLCASEGWGPPNDNGHAMKVLARHRVLSAALAERMSAAVGFRNILVHQYVDVDNAIVVAQLDDLDDLRAFGTAVLAFLEAA